MTCAYFNGIGFSPALSKFPSIAFPMVVYVIAAGIFLAQDSYE